ncbi:nitrate- and nitrite sensing domain-containing protein, partial [Streptomyces sp. NPDC004069]
YDNGSTGQFAQPGHDNGAPGRNAHPGGAADFGGLRGPAAQRPQQRPARPERGNAGAAQQRPDDAWALPPAPGPGDGRTPLFDTLETNWFRGERQQQGSEPAPSSPQQQPQQPPQTPAAPQRPAASTWRTSPNDDLVRQAERVRQPAAGGVTTSGLPRRVPRANLVPGTAQQQQHQSGPQVSRSPDEVRGRLTNLRRGIAQGRQAGTGQTGSFPSPTHQQER